MMKSRARSAAVIGALLLGLTVAACSKKDAGTVDTTLARTDLPSTAPVTVTDIQLGKSIGADNKVANQTTTFGVRDTMYVAVVMSGAANAATLTARWTYNGPNLVDSTSRTITATGGETVTEFHVSKRSPWQRGSYRVEVLLNGVSAGTKDFEVK